MGSRFRSAGVVDVVSRQELKIKGLGQFNQLPIDHLQLRYVMVLEFNKKPFPAKDIEIPTHQISSLLRISLSNRPWNFSR